MKITVKLKRLRLDGAGGIEVHDAEANTVVDGQTIANSAEAASSDAAEALAAAAAAQDTADDADDAAAAAQSTANSAASAASTAQSTANTAQTTANTAQTTANTAQTTATTAQTTANAAQTTADAAQTTADAAAIVAAAAQVDADAALATLDTDAARAVEVVQGSDGKLIKVVKHGTATTPTAYPTTLKTVTSTVKEIELGTNGITVFWDAGKTTTITDEQITVYDGSSKGVLISYAAGIKVSNNASNHYGEIDAGGVLTVRNASGAKSLVLTPADITQDMAVREIDVCDSGTPKKMLIVGSAPYTP